MTYGNEILERISFYLILEVMYVYSKVLYWEQLYFYAKSSV